MDSLEIKNLYVIAGEKQVISDLNLTIKKGEVHAIMGPNGSGKSSLVNSIAGHPKYKITKGSIILDGEDITKLSPDKRAKAGLFLSMQNSPEIPGVSVNNFLRVSSEALSGKRSNPVKFYENLLEKIKKLGINIDFAKRYLNVNFSGGEKKQIEILQLLTLESKYAILDEIDSGLDVDALKMVSKGINEYKDKNNAVLLITHYNRILNYVQPNFVHIMKNGRIVESGNKDVAKKIEDEGYGNM
jgi:Fe-S cluster assembly ATP-binding protein